MAQLAKLDLAQPRHADVDERLRQNIIAWLGTTQPDGSPHLVAVWYLWDGTSLLILSQPNLKVRNIRQNPRVTVALDGTDEGDDVIVVDGTATLTDFATVQGMMPDYAAKYAEGMKGIGLTMETMSQSYSQPILITPTRFRV